MRIIQVFLILLLVSFSQCNTSEEHITKDNIWPEIKSETKPWVRWWWMGNAVNKPEIERQLDDLARAGFGGVEITPIYGVKGYEDQYIDYLSDEWMDILQFTIQKANEFGMGVDMNFGTGWPFGGPQVTSDLASSKLIMQKYKLKARQKINEKICVQDQEQNPEDVKLLALTAFYSDGKAMDLLDFIDKNNKLNWSPDLDCEIIAAFNGKTRQKVKRAAPGGKGLTMDHFSSEALEVYVDRFQKSFTKIESHPRAFFNDSYEVYGSSSTLNIFDEFSERRGYDLRLHLKDLMNENDHETARRIQSDYRQTFYELLYDDFTLPWTNWSHKLNVLTRNQAHGSPGNIIDLYGAVDIPECETFGSSYFPIPGLRRDSADIRNVDPDPVMLKFATSAANVLGKKLVSSETFTWLAEHFKVSLSQCKPELEQVFLAGVNHVFYHGATYSPQEAGWPGWLFYASVQFGPNNSFWPHVTGLNKYIARCQSVLQSGNADNDILMYWPVYDIWNDTGRLDKQISIHNIDEWLHPTSFYQESKKLMKNGYLLDFATDRFISEFQVENGEIFHSAKGGKYSTLIIPKCEMMPVATLKNLLALAQKGATIIFQEVPKNVPGFHELDSRQREFKGLMESIPFQKDDKNIRMANIGQGKIVVFNDLKEVLTDLKIESEMLIQTGLKFARRRIDGDRYYYLVNHTAEEIDELLWLNAGSDNVILMDPDRGSFGKITDTYENGKTSLRVQLSSGASMIVRCTNKIVSEIPEWNYLKPDGKAIELYGPWKLAFTKGGPELPEIAVLDKLISWTDLADEKTINFSGLGVYEYQFHLEGELADDYLLDLGTVSESAKVWINDQEVGVLWSLPFTVKVGKYLIKGKNTIKIEVANLMANRIRYMDRQGLKWRNFHEINFVNIDYKPFDASNWNPMPSGLLGPVLLRPLELE